MQSRRANNAANDEVLHLFSGGGDLGARMRQIDWSQTPLGAAELWPQSLRTCVRILLTSRQPMFVWWGDELINLYNDAYRSILGGKHPWALGQPASAVWREIWSEVGPRAETAMKTEEGTYDEALLLIMERNGYPEETYYTFSYSPVPNDQGGTGGILCANSDDTQRIIGERQISTLRELASTTSTARTALEACELATLALRSNRRDLPFAMVYLIDTDRKMAQLAATSGIDRGHPIVRELVSLESGSDWPFADVLHLDSSCTVHDIGHYRDLPHGDWDRPPVHAAALQISGSGQTNQGAILVLGLNPFRVLDDSYRGFLSLLGGQISSAIANAQAYEEEKKRAAALAELDRAKTAFFSNVSHELRTPLTLMLGPIEDELADSNQSTETRQRLQLLHRNSLRLLKLVNALLDFSRIEAGRVQASFEPVDLGVFTAELASVFRSAIERAGLKLLIDTRSLPGQVYVDREMWEKIVLNLLSNALKSTFHGEIAVSLHDVGDEVELVVRDTGTGIPESEIPHLFERFRRVEGARRRTHEGSGIGLALVHELVSMHGGSIEVETKLGEGTAFRVRLPYGTTHLAPERVRAGRSETDVATSASAYVQEALTWLPGASHTTADVDVNFLNELPGTSSRSSHGRVLLVDDNRDMRDYVQRLLSQVFTVEVATNGREALDLALASPPDLVLSDVMMPEMDGFQLLSELRKNSSTQLVPVILLSARAGEESTIEGLEAGADDYLVKPFTARELLARVESHIRIARFRRDAIEHEKALREELRDTQRRAAEAVEQITDGFWLYDSDLRIGYMNSAAEKISGRLRTEQIGKTLLDLFPDLAGSALEENLRKTLTYQAPIQFEYLYEPWQRWFAYRVFPSVGGIVVYIRDITEEKKGEQALRRAEQLAATGRLAASIAHELNNPLEAVTNLLYLAKNDSGMTGGAKQLLDIADKELQRLSHIASKSLKFYRQSTLPSRVAISELLDSVLFFYETRLRALGVEVEKRYEEAPRVFCYSGEMQQVFTNLISNALDALPSGGRLLLAVKSWQNNGDAQVRVTIADTGIGMSQEIREQIFQPFFTTKEDTGTGLGLWVTSSILEKHGARLRVRSRAGTGTAFSLFVPVNAAQELRSAAS